VIFKVFMLFPLVVYICCFSDVLGYSYTRLIQRTYSN
jgi:hypothetical protein